MRKYPHGAPYFFVHILRTRLIEYFQKVGFCYGAAFSGFDKRSHTITFNYKKIYSLFGIIGVKFGSRL